LSPWNENFADAFGVMVKQWKLNQSAAKADGQPGLGQHHDCPPALQ
jgi:hypothetical protein